MLKQPVNFESSNWLQACKYPAILEKEIFITHKKCIKIFQQQIKDFSLRQKNNHPDSRLPTAILAFKDGDPGHHQP